MKFWQNLSQPIIGLAPMDGVTDAPFREITDIYGKPDVLFTEFVSVDALTHNPAKALVSFERHTTQTAFVAQLYGRNLEAYRIATIVACELGFDGIDINMGCPAKSIASRGAGAGLIRDPAYAQQIITTVFETANGFSRGAFSLNDTPSSLQEGVRYMRGKKEPHRLSVAISVKTRIGFDTPIIQEWVPALMESRKLAALTIHGRTLKQGYGGKAQWDEIAKASDLAHSIDPQVIVLGNGDIQSHTQAEEHARLYRVNGVLIGRRSWGNPWVFTNKTPSPAEKARAALAHAKLLVDTYPHIPFITLRKHMPWYIQGINGAAELRGKLSKINTLSELQDILQPLIEADH